MSLLKASACRGREVRSTEMNCKVSYRPARAGATLPAGPGARFAAEHHRDHNGEQSGLRELVRTNNMVLVSAIGALLDGAKIPHMVFDQNMSVMEGSLGILPRRMLVADEDVDAARRLLIDAGLGHELRPDDR